jgi:hypothetical protein
MLALLLVPVVLQVLATFVDELWFHRQRGLPRWERLGHPVDTLSVAAAYAWLLAHRPGEALALEVYVALAFGSCLLVTKDERVHARLCGAGEHWLHSVLFLLHPMVFASFGVIWWTRPELAPALLGAQLALTLAWMAWQLFYWSLAWRR